MSATLKFKISNAEFVEYKQKTVTRRITNQMIKRGELVRATHCERCNQQYHTIAHHADYGQPSKVVWLCNSCHGVVHRKYNELNPNSIKQTILSTLWHPRDYVQVSFNIPVENFIAIKKLAKETGKSFSKLIRGCVLEKYPVENDQLEFNFGEKTDVNDTTTYQRVQSLGYTEKCMHKQKSSKILSLRRKRHQMA